MARKKRLHHGIGAICQVVKRLLHPRKLIADKYPNAQKNDVLGDLLAVGCEEKTVGKKPQLCILMRHSDFDDGEILYAVVRYCRVLTEGPPGDRFLNTIAATPESPAGVASPGIENAEVEVPEILGGTINDASIFRAEGISVDDDNEPAPENIPVPSTNTNIDCIYEDWNSVTLCQRKKNGATKLRPMLMGADATVQSILGFSFISCLLTTFKELCFRQQMKNYQWEANLHGRSF